MPDLDIIAQSTCGGLNKKEGFIYAVRRPCPGSETCEQICQSEELKAQDPQIKAKTFVYQFMDCYNEFQSDFMRPLSNSCLIDAFIIVISIRSLNQILLFFS